MIINFILLLTSVQGSNILYFNDPGNDITKPKTHSKISTENVTLDFYFDFTNDGSEVIMMIEIDKISYFSLGIGQSMSDADLWVFEIYDESIKVTDSYCVKHGKPPSDESNGGTEDLTVLGFYYNIGGKSGIKFKRKADTGDELDKKLIQNAEVDFIWAHGQTDTHLTVSNHGKVNRGHVLLNLTDSQEDNDVVIEDDDIDFFTIHKWTNFVCWGIASDIGLVVGRYYKTWGYRTYFHGFLFVLIVTSSLTTAIMMLNTDWSVLKWSHFKHESVKNEFHIIIFFIFAILMIVQCIGGFIQNYILTQLKINKQASIKPSPHQIAGSIVYLIGKTQIIAGLSMDQDVRLMLVFGIVIIVRLMLEVLYQSGSLVNIVIIGGSKKSSFQNKVYHVNTDPLLQINKSDLENFEQDTKLWCIYQNQIVDLSQMIHPGGNYIWNMIKGQDVSRYILGAYSLDELKLTPYKHSVYTYKILQKYKTGIYVYNLELFVHKQTLQVANELHTTWKLTTTTPFTENISYFGFRNKEFQFKNTYNGLQTFGQYFVIKPANDDSINTRPYTMVLSMTQERIKFRKEVLELFKRILSLQPINKELPKLDEYCQELPLIIKKYDSLNGFSKYLHDDIQNGKYKIEGPYGSRLEIEKNSHVVFIAGGTGLFPFFDILEYQLRVTYYIVVLKQLGLEAAKIIDLGLHELREFKITLFLAVNSADELIGKDIYFALLSLQSKLDTPNFRMIVKGNFKLKETDIITSRFSSAIFQKYIQDVESVSNYYVCGPPKMNISTKSILEDMGIVQEKIKIL